MKKTLFAISLLCFSAFSCGQAPNDSSESAVSTEEIHHGRFSVGFVYGYAFKDDIPIALLLYDSSYFSAISGADGKGTPLVSGDIIEFDYTGMIYNLATYPGRTYLQDGRIISTSFQRTSVTRIEGPWSEETISSIGEYQGTPYVITDKNFHYVPFEEYDGEELYYTVDLMATQKKEDKTTVISAFYAYNPRP